MSLNGGSTEQCMQSPASSFHWTRKMKMKKINTNFCSLLHVLQRIMNELIMWLISTFFFFLLKKKKKKILISTFNLVLNFSFKFIFNLFFYACYPYDLLNSLIGPTGCFLDHPNTCFPDTKTEAATTKRRCEAWKCDSAVRVSHSARERWHSCFEGRKREDTWGQI